MKQSVIRICSAVLLMALALTASVATIGAISTQDDSGAEKRPKDTFVWVRMLFETEPQVQEIHLFSADGLLAQKLTTDENGAAVSSLMTPGRYYAFTEQGCAEFVLHENASVTAEGGCGWSDGEIMHLTGAEVGTVTVMRTAQESLLTQNGGWLDYTLKNDSFERREVVRCTQADGILACTFEGIPYGTYLLEENGVTRCRITLSAEQEIVSVTLP